MAQIDESGSVSGAGQVVLRPKATILRFQLVLAERGDDMSLTVKGLDRKGEALRKALLAAKATSGSIRLGTPRLVGGLRAVGALLPGQVQWGKPNWQRQQQVPQQVPLQMPAQQEDQAEATPPPPHGPPAERREPRIALQTQLVAEWPLHGTTAPELLVEADGIVRRVYEQMLPLLPKRKPGSPPPQFPGKGKASNQPANAANELPNDPFDSDDSPNLDIGEPTYVFVGVVSEQQLQNASAKAFKEATADAAAKAKIAGLVIGPPWSLEVSRPRSDAGEADPFGPASYATPILPPPTVSPPSNGELPGSAASRSGTLEATGSDPSSLPYSVNVSVTFRLHSTRRRAVEAR